MDLSNSFYHFDELRLDFNDDETLEAPRNFPLDRKALYYLHYFPFLVFLSPEPKRGSCDMSS